ncbi:MAG: AI-2E family transporter [Candidatus Zambryskibacteria bacterium]|nr:AI-2E family transporter [Candidatus Zambryskibacteria bacterium]
MLFFVLKPYLGVIFISGIFAVVFYPIYEKFVAKLKGKKNFASLITTILILIFIILPVVALSTLLFKESVNLYNSIAFNGSSQNIISQVNVLLNKFSSLISPDIVGSEINLALYARNVLNWIISNFDSIFAAVFGGILNLILMLVSLYYLFIFGGKIKKGLITWSPLPDEYDEEFIKTLKTSIDAVLRGRLLVALVQGAFIGVGFAIFGIGSPILWGFVGALASFVPILGTSIITVPAIAYLLLTNHIGAAIGLLIWAAIAVGLIDNFVSMIFFRNKIQVHPLIVLFSILGGIEVFGIIGFLIGPVVVSAFIALMKIYPFIMFYKKQSANDENIEINSGGSI